MNLRQAAEMALERLESHDYWADEQAIQALRQALNETPPCKTDPQAPHGFDRNASHNADRYVCECEGWEPPKREWVGLTDEDLEPMCDDWRIVFGPYVYDFARAIEAKLKEKNGG